MASDFVPLAPKRSGPADGSGFRVRVVPTATAPETSKGFNPATPPAAKPHCAASAHSGEPVVTLRKEGDRITGIRIQCVCGQVIDLTCAY